MAENSKRAMMKGTFSAGRLIHKRLIGEMKRAAFCLDVAISFEKFDSTWFEVAYGFEVSGSPANVNAFHGWFSKVMKELESE